MKHYKIRILLGLCVLCYLIITPGCEKNLLNKEPLAQISTSSNYVTQDDALRAIAAAYQPMTLNNWTNEGYMDWVLGDVSTDDAEKGGENGSDQLYAQQVALFNIPADNDAIRFAWSSQYIGIRRANLALDNIPPIDMDSTLKNRLLAEARFLRGYYYFKLVKTFGGVPLMLSSTNDTYDLKRASAEEVYQQIIKDLTDAEGVLPTRSEYAAADYGHATKGAADAYLGLAYLYLKDYPNAQKYFQRVLDSHEYTLDPSYANIFTVAGEQSPGIIFSVLFKNDQANPVNNQLGIVMGSRAMYGWGFDCPTQDFVDAFEPGDPRLGHTVYKNGDVMPDGVIANIGNSPTGYLDKKEYVPTYDKVGGQYQPGKDEVRMRLGKVLLWYAEAALQNGDIPNALKALNQVRARAREGKPGILPDITETNPASLLPIIWHEQRVEFGIEGERFFELVRQGRAGKILRAYAQKYNTSKGAGFRDGVNEIFPIPSAEINLSGGVLEQNTGY